MEEGIKIKVTLESLPDNPMLETFYDSLENNIVRSLIDAEYPNCEYYVIHCHGNIAFEVIEVNGLKHLFPVRCRFNDRDIYFCPEDVEDATYYTVYLGFIEWATQFGYFIDREIICNAYDNRFFDAAELIDDQYVYSKVYIDEVWYGHEGDKLYVEKPRFEIVDQKDIENIQTYLL